MRVEPELLDHPKLLRLKKRVGDKALEAVLRLWGHCQNSQRGGVWRNADPEYVEVVTRWNGKTGVLFQALLDCRFIEAQGPDLVVHDWDTFNSKARANWKNGNLGGRPTKTSVNPPETQLPLAGNPLAQAPANGKPSANLGVSESVSESVSSTGDKNTGPNGAKIAALRTQWAACNARKKDLEKEQAEGEMTLEGREEYRKICAQLRDIEAQQREGRFQ